MLKKLFCRHRHVRCMHGQEATDTIRAFRKPIMARTRCVDCEKILYKVPMPDYCFLTKKEHGA